MSDFYLPWTIFGRKIMPLGFGIVLFMFLYAWALLIDNNDSGIALDNTHEANIIGTICLLNGLAMLYGWIRNKKIYMIVGLLIAVGVFMARGTYILLGDGAVVAGYSSIILGLICIGAYTIEVLDLRRGK